MTGSWKASLQDRAVDVAGFIIGGVIGLLGSVYARYKAQAAVDVRPNLADVGFIDARLTNHGGDWLFYHYPTVATLALTVLVAVIFGIGWIGVSR